MIYFRHVTVILIGQNEKGLLSFTKRALNANARYAKCLPRHIVIINQQYTKVKIHFINDQ